MSIKNTCLAAVKFKPTPPAVKLIKNTWIAGLFWNASIAAARLLCSMVPSNRTNLICLLCKTYVEKGEKRRTEDKVSTLCMSMSMSISEGMMKDIYGGDIHFQ